MKILYFTRDFSSQNIEYAQTNGLTMRDLNAYARFPNDMIEECDAVCGDVPEAYAERFASYDVATKKLTAPALASGFQLNPIVKILTGKDAMGYFENSPNGARLVLVLPDGTAVGKVETAVVKPSSGTTSNTNTATTTTPTNNQSGSQSSSSSSGTTTTPSKTTTTVAQLKRSITFFGDSTMSRIGDNAKTAATAANVPTVNNAQGGSLAAYALFSMDGSPTTLTFNVDEIPVKGTNVSVDATVGFGDGVTAFSLHSTIVNVNVDGVMVEGSVSGQTTAVKFYPRGASAVKIQSGKAYDVSLTRHGETDGICVLGTSKNDINGANASNWQAALDRVKGYVAKCIGQVEPQDNKRFIVLTNWADNTAAWVRENYPFRHTLKDQYNNWLKETYGDRVFDIESYVLGSQVWIDAGINPSEDDLAKQAAGYLPDGLTDIAKVSDKGSHLLSKVEAKVAEKIIAQIKSLGWL